MKRITSRLAMGAILLTIALGSLQIEAGVDEMFFPEGSYDPKIPSIESIVGYQPGEKITEYSNVRRYFESLSKAAPDRTVITDYGTSWEGRQLYYVAISAQENIDRLDSIQQSMQRLADPRKTDTEQARQLIASLPAVVWLSYSVHGNEISSTDAAMLLAYYLLASQNDSVVASILKNTVVMIDPLQNPDGRDRFIHQFESARGLVPDSDLLSAEHDQPWPLGRTNHYLFDLNRDWFIQTQPETQGKIKALLNWYPVVYVDAHEMVGDVNYFFAPAAKPTNPHVTDAQRNNRLLIGKNNARVFDQWGIDYFTREIFDAFYPGYGVSWPAYFGSVSMTYEQGSVGGLVGRRSDGRVVSYSNTIRNHFISSLATLETVSIQSKKFISDFYQYRVSAIEEGKRESIRTYIFPTQQDQPAVDKLANILMKQGVIVDQAVKSFKACGRSYAEGTYIVRTDQPAKRLVRTLLDREVPIAEDFLAEQERLRRKNLRVEIYDITAWSLPLLFNIDVHDCKRVVKGNFIELTRKLKKTNKEISISPAKVAYLVPWGTAPAVRFLAAALRNGLQVKSADEVFTLQGSRYPAGTLIIKVVDNPKNLLSELTKLAIETGVRPISVDNSWVTEGPNFGSPKVVTIPELRVAIAWDQPTDPSSAGNTRFVIEQQFGYPVTPIRTRRLVSADLSRYQVLILPEADYEGSYHVELGEVGAKNLKDWVERGGVLVGLGSANRFLADPKFDILAIRRENAVTDVEIKNNKLSSDEDNSQSATVPGEEFKDYVAYAQAIVPQKEDPDKVVGALLKVNVDPDHWLGAGVASSLNVLMRGGDIYTPIDLDKGVNVAHFVAADQLLMSGYLWPENRRQLAYKPFVVVQPAGKGYVVAFTQDPNVRAFQDGLNVIFMNAVFRAPAHARPVR